MKPSIQKALIVAISSVASAAISIPATMAASNHYYQTNNNSMTINLDGEKVVVTADKYEELIRENESLEKDKTSLESENQELEKDIEVLRTVDAEANQDIKDAEALSTTENLMTVCPPYEVKTPVLFTDKDSFKMGGETYNNGFTYGAPGPAEEYYILFNLDGKYSSINFDFGHVDGSGMNDCILMVYLDGEYVDTLEKKSDELVTNETIELKGARQMKMCFDTGGAGNFADYGLANIKVTK